MSLPPYRRTVLALLCILLLSLALAALYVTALRPPGLPFPWTPYLAPYF